MKLRFAGNGKVIGQGISIKQNKDGTQSITSIDQRRAKSQKKAADKRHAANKRARKARKR